MRRNRVVLALGLSCLIVAGLISPASAEDRPTPPSNQAREKFAKLLLPNGPQKQTANKPTDKVHRVVVNAFGPGTAVNPGGGRGNPL